MLLIWLGASMFRSEPTPAPVVAKVAVESVVPEVRKLDAPTSPIDQVVPDISRSARNTISGTIRVTARLTVDKEGKVVDVALVETGPSRYFARLAAEAAEKWTFTPTQSEEPRTVRVWFYFRRSGTSARVDLPISPGH